MMIKVYLKIPGVARPHAVVGKFLFEDERYIVISTGVLKRKILWENLLYTEELADLSSEDSLETPEESDAAPAKLPSGAKVSSSKQAEDKKVDLIVAFTGAMNKIYRIEGVSASIVAESKWTPDISQAVFTNPQVKSILGGFIVKECHVDGPNITILTELEKKPNQTDEVKSKLEAVQKFAQAASQFNTPKTGRPSMRLPIDFSMSSSPFERPISLSPQKEVEDDGNREEETAG